MFKKDEHKLGWAILDAKHSMVKKLPKVSKKEQQITKHARMSDESKN